MYFFSTAAILDFSAFLAAAPTTVNCDSAMTSCVEVKQVSFLSNLNMVMIVQFTKMKPGDSTLTHKHTHHFSRTQKRGGGNVGAFLPPSRCCCCCCRCCRCCRCRCCRSAAASTPGGTALGDHRPPRKAILTPGTPPPYNLLGLLAAAETSPKQACSPATVALPGPHGSRNDTTANETWEDP